MLILAGADGRRTGPLFAIGWITGLTLLTALVVLAFGGADDPDSMWSAIADWLRIFAGIGLIALGVRKWWRRPRPGDAVSVPGWIASIDQTTPGKSLVLGTVLSGENPKNLALTATAAASMAETGAHGSDLLVAVAVFVFIGSFTVIGAVLVHALGGQRGIIWLDAVREFMLANAAVITVIILMILGAKVLGDGLAGLGE